MSELHCDEYPDATDLLATIERQKADLAAADGRAADLAREGDALRRALVDLRECVLELKAGFAVDDLKAQMALHHANTVLGATKQELADAADPSEILTSLPFIPSPDETYRYVRQTQLPE